VSTERGLSERRVRVRFAPSPTGYLHLGSARTALFNWLWARHVGGEFLIRVEDTDRDRSQPELIEVIFDALRWLGLDWDGDPVYQSDRADRHRAAVDQLLEAGAAYRCDCTQEQVRSRADARGGPPGYDGHCRDRGVGPDVPHVVRFRVPDEGSTGWDDLIRGPISFEHRNLEDFVLARSDGTPVFIVANAVDDADMGITHVIRGEDLINVTPKMLLVRDALGVAEQPAFAHVPLIVNAQRKKLSKRRDDVSVTDYRDRGYLPDALVNYLALLGWGPPDGVEIRPLSELVSLFDISMVSPSPAAFDPAKLDAINGAYLRSLPEDRFVEVARPFLEHLPGYDEAAVVAMAPELQTRITRLADLPELVDFLFAEPVTDSGAWEKAIGSDPTAAAVLDAAIDAYRTVEWIPSELHRVTAELAAEADTKLGRFQAPIRVAVTGRAVGPPLFESLAVLGRDRTLRRLAAARAQL
jgi:glutamyl-tRNA synthetase